MRVNIFRMVAGGELDLAWYGELDVETGRAEGRELELGPWALQLERTGRDWTGRVNILGHPFGRTHGTAVLVQRILIITVVGVDQDSEPAR